MTMKPGELRETVVDDTTVRWLEAGEGPPVVLVHGSTTSPGEADRFQEVDYGRRLAVDLGTTLLTIPGGKHFTPEDHPDRIAATINDPLDARETR